MMKVAVLGASNKPDRYSNMAVKLLLEHGHEVYPVHPAIKVIEIGHAENPSIKVYASLADLPAAPETISLYLNAEASSKIADTILTSGAQRIIFNPGTENMELKAKAEAQGIHAIEACTLVLLRTNQF